MKFVKLAALLGTVSILAACGGGGGGGGGGTDRQFNNFIRLERELATNTDVTSPMPTRGSATYSGSAVLYDRAQAEGMSEREFEELTLNDLRGMVRYTSDVDLRADFSNSTISGSLDNFNSAEHGAVEGRVDLESGVISRRGSAVARLDGDLVVNGRQRGAQGRLAGDFWGSDANELSGDVDLNIGNESLTGGFVTRRD